MADNQGSITRYHLNSGYGRERGVCIQMEPRLPGVGLACLWKDNPLYEEISSLLLNAATAGKDVKIAWTSERGGYPEITIAEYP